MAATALAQVIDERTPLDALLDTRHGMAGFLALDTRDRALVRAIVTVALRRRGPIARALARFLDRPLPRGARHLEHLLHVAAAQILYLDVADRAAIDLAVTQAADPRSARFKGLVNAVLRRVSEQAAALRDPPPEPGDVAPWLAAAWRRDFGRERMLAMIAAQREEPPLDLTLRDLADDVTELEGERLANGTLRTRIRAPVSALSGYGEGRWWVQDVAATLPVHLMGDVRGQRVLDLCAAPGGKTMQLAARGARVTAVEPVASRLERLRENLARTRLDATCLHADAFDVTADELGGPFDAVLLDAPCSSTGTIRRHPDVAWTKTEDDVAALADLQARLLAHAVTLVRPGGTLVFANCSTLKREGEDLFAAFMRGGDDMGGGDDVRGRDDVEVVPPTPADLFGLAAVTGQGTVRTLPHHAMPLADAGAADAGVSGAIAPSHSGAMEPHATSPGMDGFFCARLRRR